MREHLVDQLVVGPFGVVEAELLVGRAFLAQQRASGDAQSLDELDKRLAGWWRLQIFDHDGFDAALPDHRQRVARGAAGGGVIDRDAHEVVSAIWMGPCAWGRPSNQFINSMPAKAPHSSARMNPGRSVGRMPENVFVSDLAMATAGLANEVEAVNQYAAVMYRPTSQGTAVRWKRIPARIVATR